MTTTTTARGRRQGGWVLLVLGLALVVGGIVAGLTNVTTIGYDCGSAFSPAGLGPKTDLADYLLENMCESDLGSRRGAAIGMLVVGGVAFVAGGWLMASGRGGDPAVIDRLERLAQLHSDGLLTDEEYAAAKDQALGR